MTSLYPEGQQIASSSRKKFGTSQNDIGGVSVREKKRRSNLVLSLVMIAILLGPGCRGVPSKNPPVHIERDMFNQPRYNPQAESRFFPDSATMRPMVPGTVGYGELRDDSAYYFGRDGKGGFVKTSPVQITLENLKRGGERFDIYCSPCHGRVGDGQGIVVQHGYLPPPSYHADRIRSFPDGRIFDVISRGVRNMPSYANQVKVEDRWLIVSYVRALQLSQNARIKDVPEEERSRLK
jgi:mono/diheme cytochrome c family protein